MCCPDCRIHSHMGDTAVSVAVAVAISWYIGEDAQSWLTGILAIRSMVFYLLLSQSGTSTERSLVRSVAQFTGS